MRMGACESMILGAVVCVATTGCEFKSPQRSDFTRDVPPLDASFDGSVSDAPTWRATVVTVELPPSLAGFQEIVTTAVDGNNLNFLVVAQTVDLTLPTWMVELGSAEALGTAGYRFLPTYTRENVMTAFDGDRKLTSQPAEFSLVAFIPGVVPIPLTGAVVTATVSADDMTLTDGLIVGIIRGEDASTTLADVDSNGTPETALSDLLGVGDVDPDMNGVMDYSVRVTFTSSRVSLYE